MDILNRIDELRNTKGWTIFKLAEESGVNQSTLANMFSRKTKPSITTLEQICNGLGITLSKFFADTEIDFRNSENIELLNKFNNLTEKERKDILTLIDNLN